MEPAVLRTGSASEFLIGEGCYISEWLNGPADEALSVARARVPAGVTTRWHLLDGIAERYLVLEGRGLAEVGNSLAEEVEPNDLVLIPPGVRQRIGNTGDGDLVFIAICTPPFRTDAYRDVEP